MSGLSSFFGDDSAAYSQSLASGQSEDEDDEEPGTPKKQPRSWQEDCDDRKSSMLQFFGSRMAEELSTPEIPHISHTFLDATSLSELNLQTRTLTLDLCRVERFWESRPISRGSTYPSSMIRHLKNDGKASVLFKKTVINLELRVYNNRTSNKIREQAQKLHKIPTYERVHVFFYKAYAVQIAEFLQRTRPKAKKAQVFLSLTGIPAHCFLRDESGCWYDRRGTCPYSICIGDTSLMNVDPRKEECMRFDDKAMEIQCLEVKNANMKCYRLVLEEGNEPRIQAVDDCALRQTYESFLLSQRESTEGVSESETDENIAGDPKRNESRNREESADARRKRVCRAQRYKTLREISDLQRNGYKESVDVCAVVLSFSQPYRTKRGDWTITFSLVDESMDISDEKIESVIVVLFVKFGDFEMLPKLQVGGDVVALHGVTVQEYKDEVQLMGRGKEGKETRYLTYRGRFDESSDQGDEDRLDLLWRWGQKRFLQHPTMKYSHRFSVADMQPQDSHTEWFDDGKAAERGDITAVVTAVLPVPENMENPKPKGFLRIWDGTGPPVSDYWPVRTPEVMKAVQSGDPPQSVVTKIANITRELAQLDVPIVLPSPKALTGRVVNVASWENHHWALITQGLVRVGSFVRLRNVRDSKFIPSSKFRCLHLSERSSCTPLPSLTREVILMLENHNTRLERKDVTNPSSAVLPLGSETQLPTTPMRPIAELVDRSPYILETLREFVVAHHSMEFDGVVRISGFTPSTTALASNGIDKVCPKRKGRYFYQFLLRFEQDSSAVVVEALVPDAEPSNQQIGEIVFGMPAAQALQDGVGAIQNAEALVTEGSLWHARIKSQPYNGHKFFVVTRLVKETG